MLTLLEQHYLAKIAGGKTIYAIALEQKVAVAEIADHLNSAVEKLDAINLMDAVTKAVRRDLLNDGETS